MKGRRILALSSGYTLVSEIPKTCVPMDSPYTSKVTIGLESEESRVSDLLATDLLRYHVQRDAKWKNVDLVGEIIFEKVIIDEDEIAIISDGGLKASGGFGLVVPINHGVVVINHEVILKGGGPLRGRIEWMSSFRPEATGVYDVLFLVDQLDSNVEQKLRVQPWTDSDAPIRGISQLLEK